MSILAIVDLAWNLRSGSLWELEIQIRLVALSDLPGALRKNYEVHEWRHASAVLRTDLPNEWNDIIAVLSGFRLKKSQISVGGGAKSSVADSIDKAFFARGWQEKKFATQIRVDQTVIDSRRTKSTAFRMASVSKSSGTTKRNFTIVICGSNRDISRTCKR